MKTKTITGIAIILVVLLGACDLFQPPAVNNEVEYTDVVYSKDNSGNTNVTLYLDGVGVPSNESQRALTLDLAKMSHDFFEVIFIHGDVVARASWELGQNAGIRGVSRSGAGVDYATTIYPTTPVATTGYASIFVGRKSDKTLLGIGKLTHVDHSNATQTVQATSSSVTFTVEALHTAIRGRTAPNTAASSSTFQTATGDGTAYTTVSLANTRGTYTALGGVEYPLFTLPDPGTADTTILATYSFEGIKTNPANPGAALANLPAAKLVGPVMEPSITTREPRYLDGGVLWYAATQVDQQTKVVFGSTFPTTRGAQMPATVPLEFTTKSNSAGIFSFTFQVPVYNNIYTDRVPSTPTGVSTNGGPDSVTWFVRPGFGTALYNLDDGYNAGGSVLMGVKITALDWLEIFTTGMGL